MELSIANLRFLISLFETFLFRFLFYLFLFLENLVYPLEMCDISSKTWILIQGIHCNCSKKEILLILSPLNIVNLQWIQQFCTYNSEFFLFLKCEYYTFAMDTGIFLKNNQKVTKNRINKKDQKIFKNILKKILWF